jgi:dienelactone hydrolase
VRYFAVLLLRGLLIASIVVPAHVAGGQAQPPQPAYSANKLSSQQTSSPEKTLFTLKGTAPIVPPLSGDLREEQRQQMIRYYLRQIATTPAKRDRLWQPSFSSVESYQTSLQDHQNHLREILGLIQPKPGLPQIKVLKENENLLIEDLTLPIDNELSVRALIILPHSSALMPAVIAVPPENQSREEFAGFAPGMRPAKWLTTLVERNIAVVVPLMSERGDDHLICRQAGGKDRRRVLWRAGFIVGRTLVGLEVQQVLALREFLASKKEINPKQIAVMGESQGGMTALYAGAVDEQFAAVATLNYFQQRENCWKEPVDRVLYGQLNEFGDAELVALIAPRPLWIVTKPGGAVPLASVKAEFIRAQRFYKGLGKSGNLEIMDASTDELEVAASKIASLFAALQKGRTLELAMHIPPEQIEVVRNQNFEAVFEYLRSLGAASEKVRADYWQLNSTSTQERLQQAQKLRTELAGLMGDIHFESVPLRPRTALIGETEKFLAYEVLLDVGPGIEAYGQLLVPRVVAGQVRRRLPAVVCQHGFDGAPKYITGIGTELEKNDHFYHRFGERLAERGYVVFAPYMTVPEDHRPPNIVYRADLINPLVRLTVPLGLMRTSIELTKLRCVVDFLQSLSFVDPERIGYYGLSYGGYSAIWMAPLEPRLKLAVISAHFNDWQTMLTDTKRYGDSYWTLPDEDFYNWNVLNRFVHTQLIAAMWPRPVCIEYGSGDPVTTPEWHERAWQEVKAFRDSWDMQDKIVDNRFNGGHTIHGVGTFFFLDRWLWPERSAGRDYGCCEDEFCDKTVAPGFHGYLPASQESVPHALQFLSSDPNSTIRGRFYVSDVKTVLTGMAFKLARKGNPRDIVVRFGSSAGSEDVGEAMISGKDVYPQVDLWYEGALSKPVRLDPKKLYFFEITVKEGQVSGDGYTVFGPKPLGGEDDPSQFGLSFRTLTRKDE